MTLKIAALAPMPIASDKHCDGCKALLLASARHMAHIHPDAAEGRPMRAPYR